MPRQRGKNDCVVAAIATTTGKSYASVKAVCGPIRGGLECHEWEWLLGEFGDWKRSRPRQSRTAQQWAEKHSGIRAVLIVDTMSVMTGNVHAIAIVDGRVLDPSGKESTDIVLMSYTLKNLF